MSEKTVFISYRRDTTGKAFARTIKQELKHQGYDAFLDVDDMSSGDWATQILTRVPKCGHFLLVLTPDALDRCSDENDWVRREFLLAVESGRNIVPVREESVGLGELRKSCPDCMKPLFKFDIPTIKHAGFENDLTELTERYIPPHKAAPPFRSPTTTSQSPHTSIPHNLPSLQPFFGREEELKKIAEALDLQNTMRSILIEGDGGMGKTSLAVRAAYACTPEQFERIAFVSLKSRELDDDGLRDLSGFLISGINELFNELARVLGHADIAKAVETERPRLLLDALRGTKTLLILDNLESLLKTERDTVFTFVKRLPAGCKAILTSRGRIGSGAEELILEKLSQEAAIQTLAELATHNRELAKTSDAERIVLYRETTGKPLLLRWTAGQIGRGSCLTFTDAIAHLRSCPEGNDPLEFIFGDLVADFNEAETRVLCALTYFTLPAKVEHIVALVEPQGAGLAESGDSSERHLASAVPWKANVEAALKSLTNRSLVVPTEERTAFALVPLVADFLRVKKPQIVAETGDHLVQHARSLILKNGFANYHLFHILDRAWPILEASFPLLLQQDNIVVQVAVDHLAEYLSSRGRQDELISLNSKAEQIALIVQDKWNAGARAFQLGLGFHFLGEGKQVLACCDRADRYWKNESVGNRQRGLLVRLRGNGHLCEKDFDDAISCFKEAANLFLSSFEEGDRHEAAPTFILLARTSFIKEDWTAVMLYLENSRRIINHFRCRRCAARYNDAASEGSLRRKLWTLAENYSRQALELAEKESIQEVLASSLRHLAVSLLRQHKKAEALPHAQRAVEIFQKLGSPDLAEARQILTECGG